VNQKRGQRKGTKDFMHKSTHPKELLSRVKHVLLVLYGIRVCNEKNTSIRVDASLYPEKWFL
jgi:DNA-binding response OmpR family regulator